MSTVKDLLAKKGNFISAVSKDDSVLDAARKMNSRRLGSVVVMEDGKMIGIFTERDILTRVVATEQNPSTTRVEEVMTAPVACCPPDTSLDQCTALMTTKRIRHLPVMEGNELLGIITSGDLLAAQVVETEAKVQMLNQYIYGPYQ